MESKYEIAHRGEPGQRRPRRERQTTVCTPGDKYVRAEHIQKAVLENTAVATLCGISKAPGYKTLKTHMHAGSTDQCC